MITSTVIIVSCSLYYLRQIHVNMGGLGVDYTCVLDVQFGCAFHCRMRFQCDCQCQKVKNYIKNACDGETHIQTAHPKRKCKV
jgi:hypothetical protein